jgi:hypothetical protein
MNLPLFGGCHTFSGFARPTRPFTRKRQKPLTLKPLQKIPTFPSLESATRPFPFQKFANGVGQLKAAKTRTRLNDLLDQRYLFCGKFSTTEPLIRFGYLHAIFLSLLSYSKKMAFCPVKNVHGRKKNHGHPQTIIAIKRVKMQTYHFG